MNRRTILLASILIIAAPFLLHAREKIRVRVDGLSCAFCAYGLEKKLSELKGVDSVKINIKDGTALLTLEEGISITDDTIKQAVKDSGFTPREIKRERPSEKE
jgi:copper chaperone CopZ